MGGVLSSNTLKSNQTKYYESYEYVCGTHINKYLIIKGELHGLECLNDVNGSKFITNTVKKIILNNLTILKTKINDIGQDEATIIQDVEACKECVKTIIKNYETCVTNTHETTLNKVSFKENISKYSQLECKYTDETELSPSIYGISIVDMLNYINNNVQQLIESVEKYETNYSKLNSTWVEWIPYKFVKVLQLDFQKFKNKEIGSRTFVTNLLSPFQSDITSLISDLNQGLALAKKLEVVFNDINMSNAVKKKETAMRYVGSITDALSFYK